MKTLELIDKYFQLLEQGEQQLDQTAPADATDIATQPEEQEVRPLSSEGEKYLVKLLVQAFVHTPSDQEINIIDALNQEVGETNPKDVAEAIEKLLNNTREDFKNTIDAVDRE